ncbi:MAG: adenylate/guanylate cyclase domain-containing protein [Leptospira sp.]|nr:adenylate/guanylate cyclase domain-containing protein [Leptospira sp.]
MTKSEILLNSKETKGLKVTFGFRILLLVFTAGGHLFSYHSIDEVIRVGMVAGFFILGSIYMLRLIWHGQNLKLAGYLGLTADIFLLCFMPYNWYLSVGFIDKVEPSYLLKTALPSITFSILSISALAFRPIYPILLALAFDIIWLFFIFIVLNDPRTVITASFIENMFSAAVIPSFYMMNILTTTAVGGILGFLCYSYRNSIRDAVHLEVQNNQLERYFSPNVLSQIKEIESVFLAKKSKVVVLFSDIRNFTSMSESKSPEQVVQFLREYHSRMVSVIYEYGGTIDKFLGDGIMVTFGTPTEQPDDCLRAISCAIKMRSSLQDFNRDLKFETNQGIKQGIGIHYGDAISGNIGSETRLEYTVIGDTVNLASRIESQCKEMGKEILFSESVYTEVLKQMETLGMEEKKTFSEMQKVGTVAVRGKQEPVSLYTI